MRCLVITTRALSESVTPLEALAGQIDYCEGRHIDIELLIDPPSSSLQSAVRDFRPDAFYSTSRRAHPEGLSPYSIFHVMDRLGVPAVTSDTAGVELTEDKSLALALAGESSPSLTVARGPLKLAGREVPAPPNLPVIVKPNHFTGSLGITSANVAGTWTRAEAIAEGLFNTWRPLASVRIEEYDFGAREYTVGAIQSGPSGWVVSALEYIDPDASGHTIFDALEKSLPYAKRRIRRKLVDERTRSTLLSITRNTISNLKLRGCARVDIIHARGSFRIIDVNALPVLTESLCWELQTTAGYDARSTLFNILASRDQ